VARIVIIGGGIAGLAAAWEASAQPGNTVEVWEASDRFGGKILTTAFGSLDRVDEGPDVFLARVPEATALCEELGISDQLVSPTTSKAYVWSRGRVRQLPEGLVLGVPTSVPALLRSGVLSWRGIARAALEPVAAHLPNDPAEIDNLAVQISRRFGHEVNDRLVDPLIGGINAGDARHLSLAASAPQLVAAARASRSMMRSLVSGPRPSGPAFFAPVGGMQTIVDALVDQLPGRGVELHTGRRIDTLPAALEADGVIIATPAPVAARLIATVAPDASRVIGGIQHASVSLVTIGLPRSSITHALDGSGMLIPRVEGTLMTAASWTSTKWQHIGEGAPGEVVMRLSAGRFGDDRSMGYDDDTLVRLLLAELRPMLGITGDPDHVRVSRWVNAFPQYEPGHLDRVAAAEASLLTDAPNLRLAGAGYKGVGVPACIRQGRAAARDLVSRFAS
jgi:oxygen-dependent protoporphyrinogen oxidase